MVARTRTANETVLGKSSPDARNVREIPVAGVPPPLAEVRFTVQPSTPGRESSSNSRSIPSGLAASYWKLPVNPVTWQMFHASSQAAGSLPQPTRMRILFKAGLDRSCPGALVLRSINMCLQVRHTAAPVSVRAEGEPRSLDSASSKSACLPVALSAIFSDIMSDTCCCLETIRWGDFRGGNDGGRATAACPPAGRPRWMGSNRLSRP